MWFFQIRTNEHLGWVELENPEIIKEIQSLDVSQVNDFELVFANQKTQNIDLSMWDFSNIQDARKMFAYNLAFNQNLEERNFDISNQAIHKSDMLYYCNSYNYPLINFRLILIIEWISNYRNQLWLRKHAFINIGWFAKYVTLSKSKD